MARYIDADALIERIQKLKVVTADMYGMGIARGIERAETAIKMTPAADVVAVVRCKDCVYYQNHPNGLCYCWTEPCDNVIGYDGDVHCVEPDDFCSCGERKE